MVSRLKELRETLGLSMPAFGRKLGCSRDVIANIEYGRVESKEVFLNHICEVFSVNPAWLFDGQGPMFAEEARDGQVREASEIFRSLSPDLRELALSQLKSLQKLMAKKTAAQAHGAQNHLDTIRLMAAMLDAQDFEKMQRNAEESPCIGGRILLLMEEKELTAEDLLKASGLAKDEWDKIINNEGAVRRDALISVAIALSLDTEETQRLLTAAGLSALYAKNRRDSACIFALVKGMGIGELNELLAGLEEPPL